MQAADPGFNASDPDNGQAYCAYWSTSEERWVIDADAPPGVIGEDGSIQCRVNHLTDFAAMAGPVKINTPCFSCIGDLLKNPAGLIVVGVLGVLLVGGVGRGMYLHACKHSKMTPDQILATDFAIERTRVMSSDRCVYCSTHSNIISSVRYLDWFP